MFYVNDILFCTTDYLASVLLVVQLFNVFLIAHSLFESRLTIRLSGKFLSFRKVIIDERQFLFYIILLTYIREHNLYIGVYCVS